MSFDTIPSKLDLLLEEVQSLKTLISNNQSNTAVEKEWMTLNELVQYLPNNPAKATIYSKVAKNEIPYYKKGKLLYFKTTEINKWLLTGKSKTVNESQIEAVNHLVELNSKTQR